MLSTTTERRRPFLRRSVISLAGLGAAALTAGSLVLAPAAWAGAATPAAPAPDPEAATAETLTAEQALNASIEPSVVQLYIEWNGYVAFPTDEGSTWSEELTVASICTGFFVSETGQIATAGHCVDPVEGRHALVDQLLGDLVAQGWLLPEEAAGLVGTAYANWAVEGLDAGSEPQRTIYAVQPKAVEGIAIEDPLAVQLVDYRPFEQGDVALLKADVTGTVPLPVTAADPTSGTSVTSVGFPGSVQSVVDASRVRASFKTGSVSSQQISDQGVPRTEINADLSGGMSGGPTVDSLGNVVGVNSSKINGDQAFNFITDASDLHDWLTAKGVTLAGTNVPTPEPTAEPVVAEVPVTTVDDDGGGTGHRRDRGRRRGGRRRDRDRGARGGPRGPLAAQERRPACRCHPARADARHGPRADAGDGDPGSVPRAGGRGAARAGGGERRLGDLRPDRPRRCVRSSRSARCTRAVRPAGAADGPGRRRDVGPAGSIRPVGPVGPAVPATGHATGFTAPAAAGSTPPPAPTGLATAVLTAPPVAPASGAATPTPCRACGAPQVAGQRFCGSCGGQL